jgi:hypothetical protein
MAWLDMPLSRYVLQLARAQPVALVNAGDYDALDLIREFRRGLSCPEDKIQRACNLASGLSGFVPGVAGVDNATGFEDRLRPLGLIA